MKIRSLLSPFHAAPKSSGEVEVYDGFFESRRRLLVLPFAAFAIRVIPAAAMSNDSVEWAAFLDVAQTEAKKLFQDPSAQGQDEYVKSLGKAAQHLEFASVPEVKMGVFKNLMPTVEFGIAFRGEPFFIVAWRMAPHAFLPAHNHPNVSVCTVGLEGEAVMRNFEVDGEAPEFSSHEPFRVRQTREQILRPGSVNTLTSHRDNMHTFAAGKEGARGFDITTFHGANVGFSFFDIGAKRDDRDGDVFEATWKTL